ncbi:MAG: thiamine diphosphokinase [Chloroflexi bacterium]|nr:thiamine diphosphokinase [Chloroflexota bacterium]MBP7045132.1 thiamine diphosphokinase [Chloroflexota bacterium]
MTVFVFANGDIERTEWIRPLLSQAAFIIAADGGTRHLFALQMPPDLVIGDMDSISPEVMAWLQNTPAQLITHPTAKDETDLELALLHALSFDAPIWIFGALGGRLDQMLANILLLAHPALHGRTLRLMNEYERAWLVERHTLVHGRSGDLVSLIPLDGDVTIQATAGLAWSLRDEVLAFGPARGVSNVMTEDTAEVWLAAGRLLCVHTQQSWRR